MSRKKSRNLSARVAQEDRDELRMKRSGALESGYHAPTPQDIDDIRKDHSTATAPGAVNADESVRRDAGDTPIPIDSLSGELEERAESEEKYSA